MNLNISESVFVQVCMLTFSLDLQKHRVHTLTIPLNTRTGEL